MPVLGPHMPWPHAPLLDPCSPDMDLNAPFEEWIDAITPNFKSPYGTRSSFALAFDYQKTPLSEVDAPRFRSKSTSSGIVTWHRRRMCEVRALWATSPLKVAEHIHQFIPHLPHVKMTVQGMMVHVVFTTMWIYLSKLGKLSTTRGKSMAIILQGYIAYMDVIISTLVNTEQAEVQAQ